MNEPRSAPARTEPTWPEQRKLALAAWGWITVGGALSAIFSLGSFTTFFMSASAVAGAVVGGVAGLPGAMALTSWLRRTGRLRDDPREFTMTLESIGVGGALTGCFVCAWWYLPLLAGSGISPTLGSVANGLYAVTGVVLSGRWVGRRLAASHLRTRGLTVPPSWFHRVIRRSKNGPTP